MEPSEAEVDAAESLPRAATAARPIQARLTTNVRGGGVRIRSGPAACNSGGALVNGLGEVVGFNTAVPGVGLGLATPFNAPTRAIIGALMRKGHVRRAWLGGARPLPPAVRERVGPSVASRCSSHGRQSG